MKLSKWKHVWMQIFQKNKDGDKKTKTKMNFIEK